MNAQTAADLTAESKDKVICLVGMPNSGKTTLMNALTGGNFKTANYAGVTVSLLRGRTRPNTGVRGMLSTCLESIAASSLPPRKNCLSRLSKDDTAKFSRMRFILVVDATQLERHLKFGGLVGKQGKPPLWR
jgi:ferrous iron transport protein B